LIKDIIFPDARFMEMASVGSNLICFIFLVGYWLIPVPLALGLGINEPAQSRIQMLVVLYLVGLFLMLGSDYQKTSTLRHKKGKS